MEHTHYSSHIDSKEEFSHEDTESITMKRVATHEKLEQEMKESGIDCEALPSGSHHLEREGTYYSHSFAMSPRFVTNIGLIKVRNKNIDFVHVVQRN